MLSKHSLQEILQLVRDSDGCFVVLEEDRPKFVILDFNLYQKLAASPSAQPETKEMNQPSYNLLLTGAAGRLGKKAASVLAGQGHKVIGLDNRAADSEGGQIQTVDLRSREELDEIFAQNNFDAVIHLAETSGHKQSWSSPEEYFVNNVEGGINVLRAMVKHNVGKIVFRSSHNTGSPYAQTKILFERILNFYQHSFGLTSVSLRLPSLAWLPEDWQDEKEALLENPLGAVLATAAGQITCLPVPEAGESTPDGTPRLEIIDPRDAAEAVAFSLNQAMSSSGSMVYKVPGISATLGEVIEQTLEVTSRMVPTMRAHDLSLSVEEDESLESLSTLGWQPRSDNLAALTQSLWQKFENSNLSGQQTPESAEEEGIEEAQSNPISLSDLLAGRFTPFIKPHNS